MKFQPVCNVIIREWFSKSILVGKRRGSSYPGFYAQPGGKLELGETFIECAIREVKEETDLDIRNIKICSVSEFIDKKHYILINAICDYTGGQIVNKEPTKCHKLMWIKWNDLKKYKCCPGLVNLFESGFDPFKV